MKKKLVNGVLIIGSFGQTNLGDDLLMCNFVDYFSKKGIKKIFVNANNSFNIPNSIQNKVVVFNTYKSSIITWLKVIFSVDFIVYGGGTIYKELYKSTGRRKYSVIILICLFNIFTRILNKKIVNCCIGIGSVKTRIGKIIIYISLFFSNLTIFRDSGSYSYAVNDLKLSKERVFLGVDGLFIDKRWRMDRYKKVKSKKVGVNFLSDIPDWINEEDYINSIVLFIDYLKFSGYELVFVSFQKAYNKNNDTVFFNEKIRPRVKFEIDVLEPGVDNVVSIYNDIGYFIGMRLHSLILSTVTYTPFVAVNYDKKCKNYINDIRYEYSVDLEDISFDALRREFEAMKNNSKEISKQLVQITDFQYEIAYNMDKEYFNNI